MNVDIAKEVKLSKTDHLFVALAEKDKEPELPGAIARSFLALGPRRARNTRPSSLIIMAPTPTPM